MAFPAVAEFKKLGSQHRRFSRRAYSLLKAQEIVQEAFSKKEDIQNLNKLKRICLYDKRARKELTQSIYNILVDEAIEVDGISEIEKAAEVIYAESFGYSIFQPYIDNPRYNEVYFNNPWDCWVIEGLEREKIDISFRNDQHALTLLKRLTENSREGKAADDNRLNSTVLPDRVRLRWALPPLANHVSANMRKHTEEDMRLITPTKYITEQVMTKQVYSLLAGMAITGVCYGILGPGGIGKTALLRVILSEVQKVQAPRFLVSENGAELNLEEYLKILDHENVDVHSLQKWSGKNEGLQDIFANFMQAKGEYIIQPEVLYPDEVDNILMARRRGHVMGPFTFHSYPQKFIDSLTDMYLQRFQSSRESVKRTLADDVLASCYYDTEYKNKKKKRLVYGIYEHIGEQSVKPILEFNKKTREYDGFKIENVDLRKQLMSLEYIAPSLYMEVQHLL